MRHIYFSLTIFCCTIALGEGVSGQDPIKPILPNNADALAKIQQLQPNQAAIIGKAQVIGEFNDVAKQFNLDKTGPTGTRLHDQNGLGTRAKAGFVLRSEPRRSPSDQRCVGVRSGLARLDLALCPG